MKKIVIVLIASMISLCFVGCARKHDTVVMYGESQLVFDDTTIEVKDGYFYDRHEKFMVDENKIGLTIYFTKDADDSWDSEVADSE
jgi:hypothetical protein